MGAPYAGQFLTPGRFAGRVAVVTGAAQGIGQKVAERIGAEGGAVVDTSGTCSDVSRSAAGSSGARTQWPSFAMPTGTTSYRSRSRASRTLAAVAHDTACSDDRPPKTRAIRIFSAGLFVIVARPYPDPHGPPEPHSLTA